MNYQQIAEEIVKQVGGKENVVHFEHCSTRLRFSLADSSRVDVMKLEKVEGVIGVRQNVQTQVIIGNGVIEVFDAVQELIGEVREDNNSTKEKSKVSSIFLDFLVGVFQPLVPALAGAGILRSLLSVVVLFGWLDGGSSTYEIFNMIGQAPLEFLPVLVAFTTAQKLKVNPIVAASAVATLLLPDMITLIEEGATIFSFQVENIEYFTQVFPAILSVCFYGQMEKWITKISPKPIRVFFVPMISLIITVPVTLLLLGPLGYTAGSIFASVIISVFTRIGWIATALLAAILPLMVITGMHKAMIPYATTTYTSMGRELLYLPASLAHNISESGAAFAVFVKSKDKKLKATAFSGGISALCGITEPAIYGITVQHKSVLASVIISSGIGGAFIGLVGLDAMALVSPGLASIPMFIDPENSMNFVYALIAVLISFMLSFILTMFLYKEVPVEEKTTTGETFSSPVEGKVIPLAEVKDDVFSSGMVGTGVGIKPKQGILYAPFDGEVTMIFETKHAIGMKTSDDAEVLIHIGINTVNLEGKYFHSLVKVGDHVKTGQILTEFELEHIVKAGFDPTVVVVITNKEEFEIEVNYLNEEVTKNHELMIVKPRKVFKEVTNRPVFNS